MTSLPQKGQWRHFPPYELRRPPETQIFAQSFHCSNRIKLIVVTCPHTASQRVVFNGEDFTPWKVGFPTDSCFLWRSFHAFGLFAFQICFTIRNFPRQLNCIGPFLSPAVSSKNKQKFVEIEEIVCRLRRRPADRGGQLSWGRPHQRPPGYRSF